MLTHKYNYKKNKSTEIFFASYIRGKCALRIYGLMRYVFNLYD